MFLIYDCGRRWKMKIKENKESEENEEKVVCVKLVVVGFSFG